MFSCCVQSCESSGHKSTEDRTLDPVSTERVSPRPRHSWRFPQRIPKATQSAMELAPTLANPHKAGTIKAGTLEVLVDHLVPAFLFGDPSYVNLFLGTYRSFATTQQVLDLLFNRYPCIFLYSSGNDGPQEQLKKALSFILGTWLKQYAEDFIQPPDFLCLKQLVSYIHLNMPGSDEECGAQLLLSQQEHLQPSKIEPVEKESDQVPDLQPETAPVPATELESSNSQFPVLGPAVAEVSSWPSLWSIEVRSSEEKPYILAFRPELVAQQLTLMDAELLKKVLPYHCLGYICSQQDSKGKKHLASTIDDIFTHINNVITCVITTCLGDKSMKEIDRVKVVEHWIQVAMECHMLKNFSSLYTILYALQSNGILQLKNTLKEVSRESLDILQKMRKNFLKENKKCIHRVLFIKGGTSKSATLWSNLKRKHRCQKEMDDTEATIPYLGTFFTDLMRVHTAKKGNLHGGVIDLHKRKKEFKAITHISLLQSACDKYSLQPHMNFQAWFQALERLKEDEMGL